MSGSDLLLAEIDACADLAPGWDSYDAAPVEAPTLALARRVAAVLPAPQRGRWHAVPTHGGEILFESDSGAEHVTVWAEEE